MPNLFFKLITVPTSEKRVPSRDLAVCLNRHKSKSVPNCTEAALSTRYSAEARRFASISSACLAMEKLKTFGLLSVFAAGSLLLGMASYALSGDAAEESRARGSSHDVLRDESPIAQRIAGAHSIGAISVAGHDPEQVYTPTAGELMRAVAANELSDREKLRKWICMVEKRAGKQTLTEVQVETKEGPLFRLLAIDGTALNSDQRQQDDARIGKLMKDPRPLLKLKQAEDEDELKLQKLLSLMPQAFVFDYDGIEESLLRVKFRPNPDYSPPTYEARVIHNLAGTILIDSKQTRLARISGQLMNQVTFGFGLLGRIDSGTLEFERVEVGPQQWKTAFINIHFSGRAVIFKTVNKDQYERRSDFRAVSSDLSLSDARDLLITRTLPLPQIAQTSN